ncbi:MAG: hypothetical protein LBH96_04635 [Candidatus Peribacteria bacterium]|nr:hypothetical protein [Candidatus Peribacteria bacterium]
MEQTLSEVYLPSTDSEYMVGNQIFLANVGSGVITNIGLKNGVTKYTVDFNAPETYNNLAYEIKILEVLKR